MTAPSTSRAASRWFFLVVLLAAGLYVLPRVDRGWVPHDEGTLAQPAARVLLHDQLPHRDFDDMYTGGQALYHAAVFRVLGVSLLSLRVALFGAFLLTVPLLWYVATRMVEPEVGETGGPPDRSPFALTVATGAAVLLAVAWSIPVYPAGMPSWYNLFLAVAAVAAALRHLETEGRRWLVAAGVCVGLSITVKVAGFYMLATLLLFTVHREQELTLGTAGGASDGSPGRGGASAARGPAGVGRGRGRVGRGREGADRLYSLFVTAALALFVVVVGALVRSLATPTTVFHFVLPPATLAGWLVWREWRVVPAAVPPGPWARPRRLAGLLLPLLAGMALPLAAFLLPYLLSGSTGDLLRGVFVLPADRFEFAVRLPPSILTALPLAGLIALTAWAARADWKVEAAVAAVLAVGLGTVLLLSGRPPVYRGAWWLLRPLIPLLVLAGVVRLGRAARPGVPRSRLFLLLSATALVSLVQFPTAAPVYFFYAAPMAALLALALVADLSRPPWRIAAVAAAFHVAFAVAWIHTGWVYQMGDYHAAHPPTEPLALERGGIRVIPQEKAEMEGLVTLLDRVAPGPWIWVTPDAPEVYFLAERRNPTRTLFDFFDDPENRGERILRMLEERDAGAVVYNTGPAQFSGLPPIELQRRIAERYPHSAEVGRFFVRWKAEESTSGEAPAAEERAPPADGPGAEP